MSNKMDGVYLASVILAILTVMGSSVLNGAEAISCLQCNSLYESECLDVSANETRENFTRECVGDFQGEEPFCRKTVQTIKDRDSLVVVIRKCGWKKHPRLECYRNDNKDRNEISCQCFTDGCNSGPSHHQMSLLTLLLPAILLPILRK